jgi:hypothetical protein
VDNILHPCSALGMKAVCSSKTLVSTFKSTRRHNPENRCRHVNRRENLKPQDEILPISFLVDPTIPSFIDIPSVVSDMKHADRQTGPSFSSEYVGEKNSGRLRGRPPAADIPL